MVEVVGGFPQKILTFYGVINCFGDGYLLGTPILLLICNHGLLLISNAIIGSKINYFRQLTLPYSFPWAVDERLWTEAQPPSRLETPTKLLCRKQLQQLSL
jgi:hypothetical protein